MSDAARVPWDYLRTICPAQKPCRVCGSLYCGLIRCRFTDGDAIKAHIDNEMRRILENNMRLSILLCFLPKRFGGGHKRGKFVRFDEVLVDEHEPRLRKYKICQCPRCHRETRYAA